VPPTELAIVGDARGLGAVGIDLLNALKQAIDGDLAPCAP